MFANSFISLQVTFSIKQNEIHDEEQLNQVNSMIAYLPKLHSTYYL